MIPNYTSWNKTVPMADKAVCRQIRPDFTYELPGKVVIVEVDENQHKWAGYTPRCDLVRMQDIANSYGTMPMFFIRYNPDFCAIAHRKRIRPVGEDKLPVLLSCLQSAITQEICDNHITLHYICYDCKECTSVDSCPLLHTKTFSTMFDFAAYIEKTAPASSV